MKYRSTRRDFPQITSTAAVLHRLAEDGGRYIRRRYDGFDW